MNSYYHLRYVIYRRPVGTNKFVINYFETYSLQPKVSREYRRTASFCLCLYSRAILALYLGEVHRQRYRQYHHRPATSRRRPLPAGRRTQPPPTSRLVQDPAARHQGVPFPPSNGGLVIRCRSGAWAVSDRRRQE